MKYSVLLMAYVAMPLALIYGTGPLKRLIKGGR